MQKIKCPDVKIVVSKIAPGRRIDFNTQMILLTNYLGASLLRSTKVLGVTTHSIRVLGLSLLVLFAGCETEDRPLTTSEREEACVDSYLERFDINIIEGPELEDFFSKSTGDHTYFSKVKVGSSEASAILYLLPVMPNQNQIGRISNQEFEQLSEAYNQQAKEGSDIELALLETKTFQVFQELKEGVFESLEASKELINDKLCTLTYVIGEEQRRENQSTIIDNEQGCYMDAPSSAKFVVPDEKEFYAEEFRNQLNEIKDTIALRPIPLWRSNWASREFGACLLYAFSQRVEPNQPNVGGSEI